MMSLALFVSLHLPSGHFVAPVNTYLTPVNAEDFQGPNSSPGMEGVGGHLVIVSTIGSRAIDLGIKKRLTARLDHQDRGSIMKSVLEKKAQGKPIRAIAEAVKMSKSFVHKTCTNSDPQTIEIQA